MDYRRDDHARCLQRDAEGTLHTGCFQERRAFQQRGDRREEILCAWARRRQLGTSCRSRLVDHTAHHSSNRLWALLGRHHRAQPVCAERSGNGGVARRYRIRRTVNAIADFTNGAAANIIALQSKGFPNPLPTTNPWTPANTFADDPKLKDPYSQQWHLEIQ